MAVETAEAAAAARRGRRQPCGSAKALRSAGWHRVGRVSRRRPLHLSHECTVEATGEAALVEDGWPTCRVRVQRMTELASVRPQPSTQMTRCGSTTSHLQAAVSAVRATFSCTACSAVERSSGAFNHCRHGADDHWPYIHSCSTRRRRGPRTFQWPQYAVAVQVGKQLLDLVRKRLSSPSQQQFDCMASQ